MNKIDSHQLTTVLFLSGAWSVICIPCLYGNSQLFAVAVSCVLQILLCFPVLALKPETFIHQIRKNKLLGFIFIVFFIICGANGFSQLW